MLIATRNQGKLREYRSLLADVPFRLTTLDEEGITEDVEEEGSSFEENAVLKARRYAELSGLLTLADDSGLEVEALDGEPGVCSARYAGPGATSKQFVSKLLAHMKDVPAAKRAAKFRCVIALGWQDGRVYTVEGVCHGVISMTAAGSGGFGYDPVFYIPGLDKTMAEMTTGEKNHISHRAEAARKVVTFLNTIQNRSEHRYR